MKTISSFLLFFLFLYFSGNTILNAQEFGITSTEVTSIAKNAHHNVQVWEVLPEYTQNGEYQVSIKHAAAGDKGSFYIIAWADTDNDGIPDTEIGRSGLKTASTTGDWSTWKFTSNYSRIFVGNAWDRKDETIYYQNGGKVDGYTGLSNKIYYSRSFNGKPVQSTSPRFINIKIKLNANQSLFGITSTEVTSIAKNAHHNVQVWEVLPEYTQNGEYQVSIKHAAAGDKGSFYIIAWADTDNDGKPDTEIGRSGLKTASTAGDWSTWKFTSNYSRIFVGNAWDRKDETIYYQNGGKVDGYTGLSNKIYYSRSFNGKPVQSTSPRFINIKVKMTS